MHGHFLLWRLVFLDVVRFLLTLFFLAGFLAPERAVLARLGVLRTTAFLAFVTDLRGLAFVALVVFFDSALGNVALSACNTKLPTRARRSHASMNQGSNSPGR